MKKYSFLSLIILVTTLKVFGYGSRIYVPNVDSSISITHCSYKKITVLDMRVDKSNVGYLRVGAFNAKENLITQDSLTNMIGKMAAFYSNQNIPSDQLDLLIIIRDFRIEDRPVATSSQEMGTFYGRINFYLGQGGSYDAVSEIDELLEAVSGWDITKKVQQLATNYTMLWLRQAAEKKSFRKIAATTEDEIIYGIVHEHDNYPIYSQQQKKGIYYTYEEFINNTPGDSLFVNESYKNSGQLIVVFFTHIEGKKRGKNLDKIECYALFDGEKWYKKTSHGMQMMRYEYNDFYFPELGIGKQMTNPGLGVMFGIAGALIESAINSQNAGKVVYRMRLDPLTGNISPTKRLKYFL